MLPRCSRSISQVINAIDKVSINRCVLGRRRSLKLQMEGVASINTSSCHFDKLRSSGLVTDQILSQDQQIVLEPYNFHEYTRMNSVRRLLLDGFNRWYNVSEDVIDKCDQVNTMVYEAAFMFDDMDDYSDIRRGLPTCYKIFGVPRTQISGRASYLVVLKKIIHDFNDLRLVKIFVDYAIMYWTAAYKEVNWRENQVCPTVDEYRQNCLGKSIPTVGLGLRIMEELSDCKTDLTKLIHLMSLHQMWQNDCSVITAEEMWDSKGFCEDLSEGKYSLAIIHALSTNTAEGRMVGHIINQHTKDMSVVKFCHSLLQKLGSLEFAKNCVVEVEYEIRKELDRLGGNPLLVKYLDIIVEYQNEENILINQSNRKWAQEMS